MRGCGSRVAGGVYATTGLSNTGRPVEDFLYDPPLTHVKIEGEDVPIVEALGISPKGTTLFQDESGTNHIIDWVGQEHYPNVADFVEEVRVMGLSRRLGLKLKWTELSRGSRIMLVHARGSIANAHDYFLPEAEYYRPPYEKVRPRGCPRKRVDHQPDRALDMCARLWWQDLDPLSFEAPAYEEANAMGGMRRTMRKMPSFQYEAMLRPAGVVPGYQPALFMVLPIMRLEVIQDEDGRAEETAERISVAPFPITIVEE